MRGAELVAPTPAAAAWIGDSLRHSLMDAETSDRRRLHRGIQALTRHHGATVLVAIPAAHPDDYLGWAIGVGGCIAYVYVRQIVRRTGLGHMLIEAVAPLSGRASLPALAWTRAASRMAAAGYRWHHDLDRVRQHIPMERPGQSDLVVAGAPFGDS